MTDLRAAALNADDIHTETVPVPEWGNRKYGVRSMTLAEQRKFIRAVTDKDGTVNRERYAAQLLVRCVVDPDTGEQVFEPADAQALEAKSAAAVARLLTVASRLSGLGGEDQVDEVAESLDGTPPADSNSG